MTSIENPRTEPFITNKYNEEYLYSINRNSFANKRSTDVFDNYFQKKIFIESTFYIISGTDSGLLIEYIVRNGVPKGSRYLFIELPSHIDKLNKRIYSLGCKEEISVETIENWKICANEMQIDSYIYQQKSVFLKSLSATDLFEIQYHKINLILEEELQEYVFRVNASLGNHAFLDQQLMNISENIHPVKKLANLLPGSTCIVLAGGPSLDEMIDWVVNNRKKLVVIAVSRIAKRLLSANLIPDIFISVDPIHNSFEVSREMLLFPSDPLFVHTSNVNAGLLSQWQGRSAYIGDLVPWASKLNTKNFQGDGPTVTNTAISLAIYMNVSEILLAGVDLCNSQQGISHASGSTEAEITGANLSFIGVNTTTYAGDSAQTTIQMSLAARVLDEQAIYAKNVNIKVYNLSINATASEHIEYLSTNNIEFSDSTGDIQELFESVFPTIDVTFRKKHCQQLLKDVNKLIEDNKEINSLAKQALEHNKQLFDKNLTDEKAYSHKIQMDKIEKKFDTKFKVTASFIKEFGIQYFVKCVQPKGTEDWSDAKLEQTGNLYYQAYVNSCDLVLKKLITTQKRLLSRISELSTKPPVTKIIAQWENDVQLGRCHLLRKYQENLSYFFSEQEDSLLINTQKQYENQLNTSTQFKTNLEKVSPLKGIKVKILLLFKQQDSTNLAKLVQGLFTVAENNDAAAPLFYLAQAYLLCLNEQYEQSLLAFEDVGNQNLAEDEFKQIASNALKLNLPDLAESALSMLVSFNDTYLPQYANILRLLGKTEQAIDAYIKYLTTYDQDIYNWLELGKLFAKINAKESAEMAFNKVLKLDTNNQTANEQLHALTST